MSKTLGVINYERSVSLTMLAPAHSSHVEVNGVSLRLLEWQPDRHDSRPAIVLVHGLASNALLWQGVAVELSSRGHHVVAIDQRGHGRSDKPSGGYDMATVTADLAALLDADTIVTATGLQLVTLGEMDFVVDGRPVDFADTLTYKGFAYSGVPNLASAFGYINASWTLRADLISEYVCRLLNHMRATGTTSCTPTLHDADRSMPLRPWIDDFTPGYMTREMHRFPKQGDRAPWVNPQDYARDRQMFAKDPVDDGAMQFA